VAAIQHIVLLRFPTQLSDADERELLEQVRAWPSEIGGFNDLRLGRNLDGDRPGYQYSLLVEFPDQEAADRYLPHPVHRSFAAWLGERGCEAVVADFLLEDPAVIFKS
jgi:hypothetical protein